MKFPDINTIKNTLKNSLKNKWILSIFLLYALSLLLLPIKAAFLFSSGIICCVTIIYVECIMLKHVFHNLKNDIQILNTVINAVKKHIKNRRKYEALEALCDVYNNSLDQVATECEIMANTIAPLENFIFKLAAASEAQAPAAKRALTEEERQNQENTIALIDALNSYPQLLNPENFEHDEIETIIKKRVEHHIKVLYHFEKHMDYLEIQNKTILDTNTAEVLFENMPIEPDSPCVLLFKEDETDPVRIACIPRKCAPK